MGPSVWVSTRHQRWAVTGTFLTTGNTGANEQDSLSLQLFVTTVGVWEVRVTTVNDDVTLLQVRQQRLNEGVDGLTSLDQKHDSSWSLQVGHELLDGVGTNDGLALGLVVQELVDLGHRSVVSNDGEALVGGVQDQVLAHDGQTDQTKITTGTVSKMSFDCSQSIANSHFCPSSNLCSDSSNKWSFNYIVELSGKI
ncbi:hypothetical protein METSCH_A03740 [Metschnikowia aff. pulcherrima]|uniref:Uncharacterized protein n=1 Tax=Metschnikowia aff. pulcherrima TaxID=2163413 RepID=A0A4P6XGH4_9ASCO|nr:hypothetical protein METSCH_A03740 [Metschnikowia aff. pulcherrima]